MWEWDKGDHLSNLLAVASTLLGGNGHGGVPGLIGVARRWTLIASQNMMLKRLTVCNG